MILLLSNLAIPGRKNVNGSRAKGAQCFVHLNRTEQFYTNKYTLVKVTKVALLSMCLVHHKLDKLTLLGLALVGVIWIDLCYVVAQFLQDFKTIQILYSVSLGLDLCVHLMKNVSQESRMSLKLGKVVIAIFFII